MGQIGAKLEYKSNPECARTGEIGMSELYGSDAYAPAEVAQRIETIGVAKARLATLPLLMLGVLAGAFIGWARCFSRSSNPT